MAQQPVSSAARGAPVLCKACIRAAHSVRVHGAVNTVSMGFSPLAIRAEPYRVFFFLQPVSHFISPKSLFLRSFCSRLRHAQPERPRLLASPHDGRIEG